MSHFVGEHAFALGHQLGAQGMYTSWFMMNPRFFLDYYQMCLAGRYTEAVALALRMARWVDVAVVPLIQKGYMDPTLDKAFVEMAGWLPGNRRTRKPHQPMTDADFNQLKRLTAETMPEFLNYRS